MVAAWPTVKSSKKTAGEDIKLIQEIIVAVRNARSEHKIEPAKKLTALIYGQEATKILEQQKDLILNLKTGLSSLEIKKSGEKIAGVIMIPVGDIEIYLNGALNEQQGKGRLLKEQTQLEKLITSQKQKLNNQDFVSRAPEKIVLAEKEKLNNYQTELAKINKIIKSL
jgi:valyl-tRNA synthetase